MTLTAIPVIPTQRSAAELRPAPLPAPKPGPVRTNRATDYQRVVHQLVRREFALLAELASWAPPDDAQRAGRLAQHAYLLIRVLIQHHTTERDRVWPALFRSFPLEEQDAARAAVVAWTSRTAELDRLLRALGTAARQWNLTLAPPAHAAFVRVSGEVAEAVDAQISAEDATLLPLVARCLSPADWTAICRATRTPFPGRERRLVLGLALEDSCALDRARLLAGLPASRRAAWRLVGCRRHRAAIVRLRGAPPAG